MGFDPAFLSQLTTFAIGFAAVFIALLWLSLILWVGRDIRKRSREKFPQVLFVLLVILLSLPGFLLYLILRPSRTLEEEYQRALEEEALLQSIEESTHCPGCSRQVEADWLVCPDCHTVLKKTCAHCGKLMELPWNLCPYCGTPIAGMEISRPSASVSSGAFPYSDPGSTL